MKDIYNDFDFISAKEGGENTGNIDITLENLRTARERKAHFAVVVSAMRKEGEFNTTQMLENIGRRIAMWDYGARIELQRLWEYHKELVDKNFSGKPEIKNVMFRFVDEEFEKVSDMIQGADTRECTPSMENDFTIKSGDILFSLKGFGEVFCARFYERLMWLLEEEIDCMDTSSSENNISSQGDVFENTLEFFRNRITPHMIASGQGLTIVPGYIGGIQWGIDVNIGSGYSDATAALIAVSVQEALWKNKKVLLEILKSVDGIMSTDPRLLDDTERAQLIERLNFLTAKEIVGVRGAQAKLLNSDAMRPQVIRSGVSVRLRNPANPESSGTIIDTRWDREVEGVEAVLKRDKVAFISVSSDNMPQGYLAELLDIVKKYKSVDITATSETEFSFTVDAKWENDGEIIEQMRKEIVYILFHGQEDELNFVEIKPQQSLVFCIGQNMKDRVGLLAKAATALKEAWISAELVSQAQQQRAMTFWVNPEDANRAVDILHKKLVEEEK